MSHGAPAPAYLEILPYQTNVSQGPGSFSQGKCPQSVAGTTKTLCITRCVTPSHGHHLLLSVGGCYSTTWGAEPHQPWTQYLQPLREILTTTMEQTSAAHLSLKEGRKNTSANWELNHRFAALEEKLVTTNI